MKYLNWLFIAVGVGLTIPYVLTGLEADTPMPWLNGWMVGPILLVTVVPMLFSTSRLLDGALGSGPPKEFRDAPVGIGTVVSMERTGLTVNDAPQMDILMDVSTLDGQSFRGVARQLVDLSELTLIRPGTMLPVRYLPGSSDGRVVIASDAPPEEMQDAMNRVRLAKGEITPKQLRIAENGYETRAVVLQTRPTGEIRGEHAVVAYTLRVSRPDGSTFDIAQEKPMPPSVVPHVQPGMVVRAQYLPHDESEVLVITPANA
ncbi:hypothetical protein SAMN06297387_11098 [Streptomyces zhaozhouensis]|uniref:Uncharacterized protein n=1 Tax=Streptomyces zhaozhouensis TaxID=1300267 RepID=A0A286DXK6_9ACTN|nr:hypothetical protein [Streptomyces zhaozhouensis]SOD63366.1 hypothetical protein SAMN06297387_11098 [Streptomyces zhaozhouensis]